MSITVAALVKNEADRYLHAVLSAWGEFADRIVVLDDGSTDGSYEIAVDAGAIVHRRVGDVAWGAEAPARAELWKHAVDATPVGDWIFVLDADMVPMRDPRELPLSCADAVAFALYDLWGESAGRLYYRSDGHWRGHLHPRVWMARVPPPETPLRWNARGIHCGHFPDGLPLTQPLFAPSEFGILHYGYFLRRHREAKHAAYLSVAEQLTRQELAHANSIVDARPNLSPLMHTVSWPLT